MSCYSLLEPCPWLDEDGDDDREDREEDGSRSFDLDGGLHRYHHPDSPKFVHPARWCITQQDLMIFEAEVRKRWEAGEIPDDPEHPNTFHDDPEVGPTIHLVNKYYIQPETLKNGGMSWALMRHPQGTPECDIFATHAWAEGVFEFITKVRRMWPRDGKYLWVCFLANPQNGNLTCLWQPQERRLAPMFNAQKPLTLRHFKTKWYRHYGREDDDESAQHEVLRCWENLELDDPQDGLLQSPFARALMKAKYMLVIPNRRVSIYSRLWCVYEAFLAFHMVSRRNLKIRLPSKAPPEKVAATLFPGLLLWLAAAATSFWFFAPRYGSLLPPLLWMVLALVSSLAVGWLLNLLIERATARDLNFREELVLGYAQLMTIGVGFGFVQHGVRDHTQGVIGWSWEPGEGWACGFLTCCICAMHSNYIIRVLSAAICRAEGVQLDFSSVKDATCTSGSDESRIRSVIHGHEVEIDNAIQALRTVGRFDAAVMQNMDRGMSAGRAAKGAGPFRVFTACAAWSYWWVTDLSAHSQHFFATGALVATCALAFLFLYLVGDDRGIFAVDSLFYTGIAFLVSSILFARFVMKDWPIQHWEMSRATAPLQSIYFVLMCLADCWYYGDWSKGRWILGRLSGGCCGIDNEGLVSTLTESPHGPFVLERTPSHLELAQFNFAVLSIDGSTSESSAPPQRSSESSEGSAVMTSSSSSAILTVSSLSEHHGDDAPQKAAKMSKGDAFNRSAQGRAMLDQAEKRR